MDAVGTDSDLDSNDGTITTSGTLIDHNNAERKVYSVADTNTLGEVEDAEVDANVDATVIADVAAGGAGDAESTVDGIASGAADADTDESALNASSAYTSVGHESLPSFAHPHSYFRCSSSACSGPHTRWESEPKVLSLLLSPSPSFP